MAELTFEQYPFMKGYTWGYPGVRGEWTHPDAADSMRKLRDLGTEWVCLAFHGHMKNLHEPEILFGDGYDRMASDAEIRHAVKMAKDLGMKVLLKPMVDTQVGDWRGQIEFGYNWGWRVWWKNYQAFMSHYATIAEDTGSDMLCMGCEMYSAERWEDDWRETFKQVRDIYAGPLTYNMNHDRLSNVKWWDLVDLISISAYYGVGKGAGSTVHDMLESYKPIVATLREGAQTYSKPIFFAECGMMSTRGNCTQPSAWGTTGQPYDGEEQARYYEATLRAFWDEPWFKGIMWWRWDALLTQPDRSSRNTAKEMVQGEKGFRIHGKPAEKVLREWYAKPR